MYQMLVLDVILEPFSRGQPISNSHQQVLFGKLEYASSLKLDIM